MEDIGQCDPIVLVRTSLLRIQIFDPKMVPIAFNVIYNYSLSQIVIEGIYNLMRPIPVQPK